MPDTKKDANNSSSLSSDTSERLASSPYHEDDSSHPEERIRRRAYEFTSSAAVRQVMVWQTGSGQSANTTSSRDEFASNLQRRDH